MRVTLQTMLATGDRRSIGQANEVVALVHRDPERLPDLIECLWDADPGVCMRAADATEKLSRDSPAILQPYKTALLGLLAEAKQKELRWHLALIVPRLKLQPSEVKRVAQLLESYLQDRSSIVKTFAMQGLADLVDQDAALLPAVLDRLRSLSRTGTPAMRARGRLLLKNLSRAGSI